MDRPSFESFKHEMEAEGFDEVLERKWAPLQTVPPHTHPFSVRALIVEGEMWLTVGDEVRHLLAGDEFRVDRNQTHSERYGERGVTLWAARRHRTE